jgi:hypothetical protein
MQSPGNPNNNGQSVNNKQVVSPPKSGTTDVNQVTPQQKRQISSDPPPIYDSRGALFDNQSSQTPGMDGSEPPPVASLTFDSQSPYGEVSERNDNNSSQVAQGEEGATLYLDTEPVVVMDNDSDVPIPETNLSQQDIDLASLINDPQNIAIAALIQNYTQIDNKLDTFFFETVDGMFEYLLFLILYKYLDIFGSYAEPKADSKSSDSMDDEENGGGMVGGVSPDSEQIKGIQLIKLYKELNHDFKGVGKTLDDMLDIRYFCLEYLETNAQEPVEENLKRLYKSMMNGSADEWNFYTSILEYYCESCGKFNDLTMIRYKSRTDKESGNKDYIIRDINSYPSGENSYSKLFVEDDFLYRFQDNGTTNGLLSKLVKGEDPNFEGGPNLDVYIKVIQNAPSLIDPATVYPINMTKFYPVQQDDPVFCDFQKCQDLNNTNQRYYTIIQNIMKKGINNFFSYFNVPKVPEQNMMVKFVVFQDGISIDTETNNNYISWLKKLNENAAENRSCPFFYQGIRININSTPPQSLELHVGDIAIPNIASLINSKYYLNQTIETIDQKTIESWERVKKFAEFIRGKSGVEDSVKKKNKNDLAYVKKFSEDFLRFIIISMKSFGDSFQVYYSTAIQNLTTPVVVNNMETGTEEEEKWEYNNISSKTYLSSSDKNTGAEKMLYDSPFLLNGCGIRPYQGLQDRFPDFFNVELTENELNDNGDVGSKHTTNQYKYGSSKALLTNIKSKGKDYKRYIQILCNQIVRIVNDIVSNNPEIPINVVVDTDEMRESYPSKQYQTEINSLLGELIDNNDDFIIDFENIEKGCLDPGTIELQQKPFEFPDEVPTNDANQSTIDMNMAVNSSSNKSPSTDEKSDVKVKRTRTEEDEPVEVTNSKILEKILEKLYNRLKIYQETDNALDNKIDTFLNDFELQEKYLTKLIDLKRSPTTDELDMLLQKLQKDPGGVNLQADLEKLVSTATGIKTNSTIIGKMTNFINRIKDKVNEKKKSLEKFIGKIKMLESVVARSSSRVVSSSANAIKRGLYGLMDSLNKPRPTMPRGGKNRTIKNRHAYMKKYTRKHGHSTNKRKTRHASQEKRKHKTQRKYM